jgi:hypothetical protein
MDEFRDIPGCEGYQANRLGQVKGKFGKILKPNKTKLGYNQVAIYNDDGVKKIYVHRIIGFTFLDNPKNLPQIDHIDNDTLNNCVDNLRWITAADNMNRRNFVLNAKCYSQTKCGWKVYYSIEGKIHYKYFKQEQEAVDYVAQLKIKYPRI